MLNFVIKVHILFGLGYILALFVEINQQSYYIFIVEVRIKRNTYGFVHSLSCTAKILFRNFFTAYLLIKIILVNPYLMFCGVI